MDKPRNCLEIKNLKVQLQLATDTHITDINITLMAENKRPPNERMTKLIHSQARKKASR